MHTSVYQLVNWEIWFHLLAYVHVDLIIVYAACYSIKTRNGEFLSIVGEFAYCKNELSIPMSLQRDVY